MCGSYCHHSSYDPFVLNAKFQGHRVVPARNRPNPKKGTQTFLDEIESIDVALRNASMSTDRAR